MLKVTYFLLCLPKSSTARYQSISMIPRGDNMKPYNQNHYQYLNNMNALSEIL